MKKLIYHLTYCLLEKSDYSPRKSVGGLKYKHVYAENLEKVKEFLTKKHPGYDVCVMDVETEKADLEDILRGLGVTVLK